MTGEIKNKNSKQLKQKLQTVVLAESGHVDGLVNTTAGPHGSAHARSVFPRTRARRPMTCTHARRQGRLSPPA